MILGYENMILKHIFEVVKLKNDKKIKKYQEAEKYYVSGMSIPDIARFFSVKEATVKTWIRRHGWKRTEIKKNSDKKTEIIINGKNLYEVKEELIQQLEKIGKNEIQYVIEVEAYISSVKDFFAYENDLKKRGHLIETKKGIKQNESACLKNKASQERRRILEFLTLNDVVEVKDDEGYEEL